MNLFNILNGLSMADKTLLVVLIGLVLACISLKGNKDNNKLEELEVV